jgi:hypothetical protein
MQRQIQEIQALATKYSKADLGRMVQLGLLDPQKAMMAGMMIQRIEQQNAKPPQATVAQEVLGLPTLAVGPQSQTPQLRTSPGIGTPPAPPLMMTAADGGLLNIPSGDVGEYAGGGIVAFDDGGEVEGYAKGDLVPSGLFEALVQAESRGKHSAVSSKGARGAAQLMPGTMRDPGYGIKPVQDESLQENLRVGREYLGVMLKKYGGNVDHALAAYNWGPGNVDKWLRRGGDPSELPRETKTYIPRVKNFMAQQRPEPAPVRVAERPQMDEEALAGMPAGQLMPARDRIGMPSLLRRPLERVARLLPSAGAGGIEDLPAGMQPRAEYASGGITAFQEGGLNMPSDLQTPFDTSGGSNTVYGMTTTDVFRPRAPEEETSSMFGRGVRAIGSTMADIFSAPPGASERYGAQQDVLTRQQALRARLQQLEGYGFRQQTKAQQAEAEQIRKELSALEGQLRVAARTQSAPPSGPSGITPYKTKTVDGVKEDQFPLETYQERLARRQTGVGYTDPKTGQIVKEGEAPPSPPPAGPEVPPFAPGKKKVTRPKIDIPSTAIDASFYQGKKPLELSELSSQRMDHMRSLGVDPDMYKNMLAAVEDKKGKLAARKGESQGEAMMRIGLGLIGSRQGKEFEDLREHGLSALNQYKQDVKDLRAAEEKLDDRMDALRIADQQAKQSGAEKDIARRQQMEDSYEAAQSNMFKQRNEVRTAEANLKMNAAQLATNANVQLYGYELTDERGRQELALRGKQLDITGRYYDKVIAAQEARNKALGQAANAKFMGVKQKILEGMPSDSRYAAFIKDLKGRYGDGWANIPKAQTEFSNFQKMYLGQKLEAMGELDLGMPGIRSASDLIDE